MTPSRARTSVSIRPTSNSTRQREPSERLGRVETRLVETGLRLATGLTAVAGVMHSMRDAFLEDRELRRTVDDHERRLRTIERKTG